MSKKEAGIIGIIGAGILGLGLLFGLGGKKKAEDNPNNIIGSSGGGLDGYGYNNPIIGGSSGGAGIGSGEATKPGTPYVIVNPPIVYGGGGGADIVSEAPNPDYKAGNIDGADNSAYGQNSTADYNRYTPSDWQFVRDATAGDYGTSWKMKNTATGETFQGTYGVPFAEDFNAKYGNPNSKFYREDMAEAFADAYRRGTSGGGSSGGTSGGAVPNVVTDNDYAGEFIRNAMDAQTHNNNTAQYANAAEEISKIYADSAATRTGASSGILPTTETPATPAHAEPEHRKAEKMPDFGRGIVAYKARQAWQREHGGQ